MHLIRRADIPRLVKGSRPAPRWAASESAASPSALQVVGFLVQGGDQAVDAVAAQDPGEFRAPRRQLPDRAGQVDVADLIADRVVVHQIADRYRLAIRFDDLRFDQGAAPDLLLAEK